MTMSKDLSRRELLMKVGILLDTIVGVILGVPIVRYLMSPVARARDGGYDSWVPLGNLQQFPSGETRFATYRNPVVTATDGVTAETACWVRNIDGKNFQVFAVNCAHLGCPVRWFPQSSLFMCPCHGGVYYQDGSRASGPPERGLFQYDYRVDGGQLMIKAGQLPTPGDASASNLVQGKPPCG